MDLSNWKPQVQAEVKELQIGIHDLKLKFEQLSTKKPEGPANKVFDTEDIDLTGFAAAHLAGKPYGGIPGPRGHGEALHHWVRVTGWSPPTYLPWSQVRVLPRLSRQIHLVQ